MRRAPDARPAAPAAHPLIHYAETALAQGETDSALKYFDLLYRQAVRDTAHSWQGRGAYGLARAQLAAGRVGDAGAFRRVAAAFPRVRSTDDVLPDNFALDGMLALASGAPAEAYSDFVTCLHDYGFYSGERVRAVRPAALLTAEAALARGWPDSALRSARTAAAIAARLLEPRALLGRGDTAAGRLVLTQALRGLSAGGGDGHPRRAREDPRHPPGGGMGGCLVRPSDGDLSITPHHGASMRPSCCEVSSTPIVECTANAGRSKCSPTASGAPWRPPRSPPPCRAGTNG